MCLSGAITAVSEQLNIYQHVNMLIYVLGQHSSYVMPEFMAKFQLGHPQ